MRAAALAGIDVPKLCATDSLDAFGSCRLCLVEIDGRRGTPASCTTPVAPRHVGHDPDPRLEKLASRGDGALHLRPPAGLPHLPGERRLRAAGHGRRRRSARRALRLRRREPPGRREGRQQPVLHLRPRQVHRLLALRPRLRRGAGHLRARRSQGRGFDSKVSAGAGESFLDSECVSCGACVQACPTVDPAGEDRHRARGRRPAPCSPRAPTAVSAARSRPSCRGDQVVRMVPAKDGGANEGHSCVKGRFAWGYATHRDRVLVPDGPRHDRRPVARGRAGTRPSPTPRARLKEIQAAARRRLDRWHHLVALHERRGLRRPEDDPRRLRQQQRRHLRPGVPLPHGLRAQADVRHVGRHPGLPLGRGGRRHRRDRGQPDRRSPGVRLADEAPAARGRAAHRRRPAPHRPRAQPAHRGGPPPPAAARAPTWPSSTRWRTWSSPRA